MSSRNRKSRRSESNRNSRIVTRPYEGTIYARSTYTSGRDEGTLVAAVDTASNNTTTLQIARAGAMLELNGHEARTLFRLLETHYFG